MYRSLGFDAGTTLPIEGEALPLAEHSSIDELFG
jgi:hypothetical protein